MSASTPAARLKIEDAKRLVEEAQNKLDRACQALCSVRSGADLYRKTGKLSNQVGALWYKLDDVQHLRGGMSVDSECERCGADLAGWRMGDPIHRCEAKP